MNMNRYKWLAGLALITAVPFGLALVPQGVAQSVKPNSGVVDCFTGPSKKVEMHFLNGGIIKAVAVKEGQVIKAGEMLMSQDDDIEKAELERMKDEATSEARILYYQAGLDVSVSKLNRMEKAEKGAFADAELDTARAEKIQAERQIDVSKLDHKGDISKSIQQEFKVAKMKLYAPWDGVVEKVGTWEGELATPDKDKPSIILVKNDPCNVVITTFSTAQVSQIHMNDIMEVKYPDESQWRQAKVSYIAPVAETRGNVQLVRLELPNPENRSTGLPIQVKLPAKLASAAK